MNLPNNADGDVIRRLSEKGFDFSREYEIDFNVDFNGWPPPVEAILVLRGEYPNLKVVEEGSDRYLHFKIKDRVSYDLVVEVQQKVTSLVSAFGGYCDSWGVLH